MQLLSEERSLPDVARQVEDEFVDGYAIRHVASCLYPCLRWQAGKLVVQARSYRGAGMGEPFHGTVTLFWLLGHGETREEALEMAKGRNGGAA